MTTEDGEGETTAATASAEAVALAGWRTGKSQRQIAVDLFGAARVDAEWSPDSQIRAKVRRLLQRARAASCGGSDGTGPGTS